MNILILSAAIIFAATCIMYFSIKRIAADIYIKTVRVHENLDPDLPASPYSLQRAKSSNGHLGYTILKNDKFIYIAGTNNFYDVYGELSAALRQMNIYEKLDSVKLTKLD